MGNWNSLRAMLVLILTELSSAVLTSLEPKFDMTMVNVTAQEKTTAVLPCSVGFLGKYQVVWTKEFSTLLTYEDRRIINDERISVERPYTREWNLYIRDVRYSDQGIYYCQINTNPVKIKTINLIVLVQTSPDVKFDMTMVKVTAQEKTTAVLPCSVGFLGTYKVTWTDHFPTLLTLEDSRIIDDERISVERPSTRDWNLHIRDVRYSDHGTYHCQINTNPIKVKTIILFVLANPELTKTTATTVRTTTATVDMYIQSTSGQVFEHSVPSIVQDTRILDRSGNRNSASKDGVIKLTMTATAAAVTCLLLLKAVL